jgi:hypothetical protein
MTLEPGVSRLQAAMQALLDKQAITEQLMRYCRGIDRMDRGVLESVYWPDAIDDHVRYVGDVPGFIDFAFGFLANLRTQHTMSNILIELISQTEAHCESYVQAYHEGPTPLGREELIAGARYLDVFEKRGQEWRIQRRTLVIDYYRRAASTCDWDCGRYKGLKSRGEKSPEDPLYRVFARSSPA